MLEIIVGKDWTANSDAIMQMISRDVRAGKGNRILLVPELVSHDTERMLCQIAGDTASRFAEVLSFSRLARRVATYTGNAPVPCMDNAGRLVVMAAAARQLHGSLKVFAAVENKPELLSMTVDMVDECKRCCISPEELDRVAHSSEGEFAQKMSELSLLLKTYDALCVNGKRDPRDLMNWVLEELEESDFAENHVLYMDAFPDLTRQHMAIMEHFIRFCPQVTVSLNCDRPDSSLLAFEKAGQTAEMLISIARRAGVPYRVTEIRGREDNLSVIRDVLFQGSTENVRVSGQVLRTAIAPSVHIECQIAARQIMDLIHNGCRYRDIALVCPQMENYRAPLTRVLNRAGIPFYTAGTDPILHNPVVSTIFTALSAALDGFEQKDVLHYLRSALSPLNPDLCDLVENYAYVWNVNGSAWKKPWVNHPDGFSGYWTSQAKSTLQRAEFGRSLAIEPLQELHRAFHNAASLTQQVEALETFLDQIRFCKRLEKMAYDTERAGDSRAAQILIQLCDIIPNALQQLTDVLGNTLWDGASFQRLLGMLISQYDVGTIPTVLDAVHIGPVSAMRCQSRKHLIVLGCEEGSLPGYSGSTGLLSDMERDLLRSMDVPLTGGALEGIQAEFAEVYGVFCGARESISLYCSASQPSYVYRRLAECCASSDIAEDVEADFSVYDAAAMLSRYDAQQDAKSLGIGNEYEDLQRRKHYQLGTVGHEHIESLYGSTLNLSASQVDTQASCRLHYFLRYGLNIQERKEAKVDPAEFGTYVHDVLEHTVLDVIALGGFHEVSLEKTLEIAMAHSDRYAQEHFSAEDSRRLGYQFERHMQELDVIVKALWDELHISNYLPVACEVQFGKDGPLKAIDITGGAMSARLNGFVDRVDVYREADRTYFRVVDYKTGIKSFDLCDVFNGIGLQMLLYMYALAHSDVSNPDETVIAAGVQYFSARAPFEKTDAAVDEELPVRQTPRKGLLLNDDLSLAAMDPRDDAPTLGLKGRRGSTNAVNLADGQQLDMLRRYVFKLLASMVDDIASGQVTPNPYCRGTEKNVCTYCPYAFVCHKDSVPGRRNYKAMDPQRFWDEIGKELHEHG